MSVAPGRVQEPDGSAPAESKMRNLPPAELLAQLPPLQKLLERLMDCLPRGVAARHFVVQASLLTIAKESFQVHSLHNECPMLSSGCCTYNGQLPRSSGQHDAPLLQTDRNTP
jgi:ANTH domain